MKILVAEDEKRMNRALCELLRQEGYEVASVENGEDALSEIESGVYDLIVLDVMMPGMSGYCVAKRARAAGVRAPILMLTARSELDDKVEGLDSGADDYLTKPFSATELMARIRVAERHLKNQIRQEDSGGSEVRELRIDLNKRLVYLAEKELHVTPMEYQLLEYFFQNIGKVLTTKSIIEVLWGKGYGSDTQALRSLMAGLRRKIEKNPAKPEYIITEIGVGYRLLDQ